jgi:threonine/homoserine/homoserine lactone efflux protein
MLTQGLRWAGSAFLLSMAWRLAGDRGSVGADAGADASTSRRPSMLAGAAMQWLNPKAWLATLSGTAVYGIAQVGQFAAIYFGVCFASIAAWAVAGGTLTTRLVDGRTLRRFNIAMAALLAASAVVMLGA